MATVRTGAARDGFVPIVEPFAPGHPAAAVPIPASCSHAQTTLALEECADDATEDLDHQIDRLRAARFRADAAAGRALINSDDRAWLAARGPVCQAAYNSGGSIDIVEIAMCLTAESRARLDAVKGLVPPVARLPVTDNTSTQPAFYTTPSGSRIGMVSTQGDQTGGAIIAWTVIGGYLGCTVTADDFPYVEGTSRVYGLPVAGDKGLSGHRVATAHLYVFDLDYQHLGRLQPPGRGAWEYRPGGVAVAVFG